MDTQGNIIKWIRVVIAAAMASAVGIAVTSSGSQAALEYDTDGSTATLEELTRFQIDGDRVETVISNSLVTLAPGVNADWESTPYGPQPIGTDPSQLAPAGIGSSGLLPFLFADIKSDDFPTVSPSPNPAFGLPGEPEFCVPNNEDAWVGGEKVQFVNIDNPLFNVNGDQALQCAQVLSKGDLFSVYAAYETVAIPNTYGDPNSGSQNHVVLYGAWERGEVPGELNFYIPISDAVPGNSAGDRLIAFDYDSSAPASYRILAWDGLGWAVIDSGSAAVNGDEFAAAVGFADGTAFTAGAGSQPSFGEFALDLTATGILPDSSTGECVELTTAGYVFTETGNSANAQLKDYVGSPKLPIGNCGSFSVTKAGPAATTVSPLFDYRVEQQDSAGIFSATATPATTPTSSATQLNSQFQITDTDVWVNAFAEPDYVAFEEPVTISGAAPAALPQGWDMISVDCTYVDSFTAGFPIITERLYENGARTVDGNGDQRVFQVQSNAFLTLAGHGGFVPNCVITNDAAGVIVTKAGTGDAAQTFDFDAGGQTDSLAIGDSTFFAFDSGSPVTISELPGAAGWELSSIECFNEDGSPNATGDTALRSVDVTVGDTSNTIECVFTNNQLPRLTLVKNVVNDNGGGAAAGDWTLTATGPTGFSGTTGVSQIVDPGSYDLSESGPALYTGSAWSCTGGQVDGDTVALAYADDITCTITNDDDAPSLTLVKEVINDNGGTSVPADWTLTAAGYSAASPQAGSYDLSESGPSGYTLVSLTCDNAAGQVTSVTLGLGEDVTCTFVNDDDAPSLTLVKEVINDNGGTSVPADWTLTAAGYSAADPQAGSYDLSESGPAGYTLVSLTCDNAAGQVTSVTLGLGEDVTCTFVNDDNAPGLTLIKEVVNDNGGTAAADAWTLTATGPTGFSGTTGVTSDAAFEAGTYDLSEAGPSGYTASDWVCVGGSQDDADTITVGLGESATCTITNDDDPPGLTLVKVVVNDNGGTSTATDWTLTATGPTGFSGTTGVSSDAAFDAGTYDLSEAGPSGYTASDWICDGGTQVDGDTITVGLGQSATCTITNNDDAPTLTLVKVVVNDNGGTSVAADWTLTADGPTGFSGTTGVTSDAAFDAGTYDLSEAGPSGYTASDWVCDGGTQDDADTITVGLGESATCTITNDDDAPSLTLIKMVVNDNGGTAAADAWTLTADGPTGFSGTTGVTSDAAFDAGTYDLTEVGPAGYTLLSLTCSNSAGQVTSVTLGLGEDVTCIFVNDDDAPTLTLVKVVVNDNGGTAAADAWTLTADGPTGFSGTTGVTSDAAFDAGTYDLSEAGPSGYTASDWVCDGGTQDDADTITVGLGESATCTITNDDNPPGLTLIKVVVNDNGGTSVAADWTLTADGPTGFSGTTGVSSDAAFEAGTYDLSEAGPSGYTASDWVCDGGTQDDGDTVTVALGEAVACTITNDDDAPTLTLVKVVVNDNGGTSVAADWTLTADGPTGFSGTTGVSSDAAFDAGTYDLSEAGPSGYTASDWVCDGGTQDDADTITVGLGESATCTITNDDDAPGLTLVKVVVTDNGGTAVATDWTLTADGPTGFSGTTGVTSDAAFDAGTYDLSEAGPTAYAASDWVCVGGTQDDGDTITLGLGESATCTITNDDNPPGLTLLKVVVNDDGGNSIDTDWTLTADGPTGFSGTTGVSSDDTFEAGTYDLSEAGPAGYSASDWVCEGGTQVDGDTITLAVGEAAACTITNDDDPVDLELTKTDDGFETLAGGDPIPYTITVQNIGTRDVDLGEPVTVTDELPAFLSWNTFPANCVQAGQVLTCDIDPALMTAGGAAVVIEATVDVAPDAPSGDYENRAWVTTDDDPVCEGDGCVPPPCDEAAFNNNVDCEDTPIERFASIFITKTDDVADGIFVQPGETYTYELVVGNLGPSTVLANLAIDDDLPEQLSLVSAVGTDAAWVCNDVDPIECTWTGDAVFPGETLPAVIVTVLVNDDAVGEFIENVAITTALVDELPEIPTGLTESHFGGVGDIVTAQDDEVTPLQSNADLAIVKTASLAVVGAGGGFDWTLDITNNGPATAINVVIGDLVPATLVVTGVSSSDFSCGHTGNDVECTIGSLAVGASGTVVITVTVPLDVVGGDVVNVGTVESDTPDPDLTNNSDDATVTIVAQAPPTTVAPELPKTGSDITMSMARSALLLVLLGGGVVLVTRRRRDEEIVGG